MHNLRDLLPVFVAQVSQRVKDDWWKWALAAMAALMLLGINDKMSGIAESDKEMKKLLEAHIVTAGQEMNLMRERLTRSETMIDNMYKLLEVTNGRRKEDKR